MIKLFSCLATLIVTCAFGFAQPLAVSTSSVLVDSERIEYLPTLYSVSDGVLSDGAVYLPDELPVVLAVAEADLAGLPGVIFWSLSSGTVIDPLNGIHRTGLLKAEFAPDVGGEHRVVGVKVSESSSDQLLALVAQDPNTLTEALRSAARDVPVVTPYPDPAPIDDVGAGAGIGASCSCPKCPNGMTFRMAFVVVGVSFTPNGQMCCGLACYVACNSAGNGADPFDAWVAGQGTWVACMIGLAQQ